MSIIDSSFVRADFYCEPPTNGNVAEWKAWQKDDNNKARAAKAAYTKSFKDADKPEELTEGAVRKINGCWRQCLNLALSGDSEGDGFISAEPVTEAEQEAIITAQQLESARHKRGGRREGKSARRRANRKAREAK